MCVQSDYIGIRFPCCPIHQVHCSYHRARYLEGIYVVYIARPVSPHSAQVHHTVCHSAGLELAMSQPAM